MRFDTLMIGGGLAGLACGIRLAEQGQRCAIVSAGQSALHFSSGSLDLLARLPDGSEVTHPLEALAALAQQAPLHPYSLMGAEQVATQAAEAEALLERCGMALVGSYRENHLRVTPLGTHRATWLSPEEVPTLPLGGSLPWRTVAVVGVEGFLDFQPQLVASSLQAAGVDAEARYLSLPALDRLRNNPSEFRAVNIARVLDLPENLSALTEELTRLTGAAQALILPACLGLEDSQPLAALRTRLGKPVMLLPTLPPSVLGMRLYQRLRRRFQQLGGMIMPGDAVLRAEISGRCIKGIYTRNHGDIPLRAQRVVLASGSFFSNGLQSTRRQIIEPVFGLDLITAAQRADWSRASLCDAQPYLQFGVRTDSGLHPQLGGQSVENLYAIGAVVGGYDPLHQGCGAGVSLLGALYVAQQIMAEVAV